MKPEDQLHVRIFALRGMPVTGCDFTGLLQKM
jgi:hypothetical protein